MNKTPYMVVAGTGHRPDKLGGYGPRAFDQLTHIAYDWLLEHRPVKVISGMALGWDQALAVAAIQADIPVTFAIPFIGQDMNWTDPNRLFYENILGYSYKQLHAMIATFKEFPVTIQKEGSINTVVIVSPGPYSVEKMQIRNRWMVDNCTHVLAMFDGSEGGTNNCVNYAESKGKIVENIYYKLFI